MSYTFLQEPGVESSAESFADIHAFAPSSWRSTLEKSYSNDSETACCRGSQYGMMSAHSTGDHGEDGLTSCVEGFPVKTSAQQDAVQASRVSVPASGLSMLGLLARWDRDSSLWRTPQSSLLGDSDVFSETWPRWGTMRLGACWELATPARRTNGSGSGLWPTATICGNYNRKGASATSGDGLATAVAGRIPTPRAEDSESCGAHRGKQYPTPSARDWKDTPGMATEGVNPDGSVRRRDDQLARVVYQMTDAECRVFVGEHRAETDTRLSAMASNDAPQGSLNPDWVELLMGWPLGWTSLEPLPRENWERWMANGGGWSENTGVWPTPRTSPGSRYSEPPEQFLERNGDKAEGRMSIAQAVVTNAPSLQAAWEQNAPRVAVGVKNRQARLKAIGNGQVCLCVVLAMEVLT